MSPLAIILVVSASLIHATWNLLVKRSAAAGVAFVISSNAVSCLAYLPWVLWVILRGRTALGPASAICILFSGVLHLAYSLCLQKGYRVADFSIVYPVARGTGPMVSVICAIAFLHERATWLGLTGTTAVLVGIVLIAARGHLDRVADSAAQRGIRYGAATGSVIAAYTVVDAYGVKTLGLQPVILDWCANTVRLFMLLPWFLSNPRAALATMKGHMLRAIIVGLLSPLSYILVLGALQLGAPVSLVAPAREMSMMIGAVLGVVVLGEPVGLSRAAGCLLMLGGVILISCS